MDILNTLFGSIMLLLLTLSGLLLIVAPPLGRRLLQNTVAFAALLFMLLVGLNTLWQIVRSINPLALLFGTAAVSTLAYFVRERRLGRSERREGSRHTERSPVMPQHADEEAEE